MKRRKNLLTLYMMISGCSEVPGKGTRITSVIKTVVSYMPVNMTWPILLRK